MNIATFLDYFYMLCTICNIENFLRISDSQKVIDALKENGWFFEPSRFHNLASIEDMTIRYPVAIREENGTYCATVPDLPGVITEANSIDELVCAIEEASLGWMEAEIDDGREIPKPSLLTRQLNS